MEGVVSVSCQRSQEVVVGIVTLANSIQLAEAPVSSVAVIVAAVEHVRVMVRRRQT